MKRTRAKQALQDEVIQVLVGKPCWYASCGGAAGPTFSLALGEMVPRERPVRNPKHSEKFRQFEGEASLYVWCTWRLDNESEPISSSDDTDEHICQALDRLVETNITDVKITMPAWDLEIAFSNGLTLRVFCDHVPGDPSFDGNWELVLRDRVISIGVGSVIEVETRTAPQPA